MRRPELDYLLTGMLDSQPDVSDLLFTADKPLQVESFGELKPVTLDPPIEKKIQILHLMEDLGIDSLNLGLPGAGPRAKADVLRLAREIVSAKLRITGNCAARTIESDIIPIADVVQAVGGVDQHRHPTHLLRARLQDAHPLGSPPLQRCAPRAGGAVGWGMRSGNGGAGGGRRGCRGTWQAWPVETKQVDEQSQHGDRHRDIEQALPPRPHGAENSQGISSVPASPC